MTYSTRQEIVHFIGQLQDFEYKLSCSDHVWEVPFKSRSGKWCHLHVVKYQETFYASMADDKIQALEINLSGSMKIMDSGFQARSGYMVGEQAVKTWGQLIASAGKWLEHVRADWIKASRRVQKEYPLNCRYGTVPGCIVKKFLPDVYNLANELGRTKTKKIICLIEDGIFSKDEKIIAGSMTADKFFQYCKLAYIAGARKEDHVDSSLSGREMYKLYADGRHEGLLDIAPDSEREFADWIDGAHPKKTGGGHPWEIKRGGNTTHIDLSVFRTRYGKVDFIVQLRGESLGRMAETLKMLLAIYDAGLPIAITNPEAVRKRLIGQDNIGIVPEYCTLHRANQHFLPPEDVFDVVHYEDLGRAKKSMAPFIRWEQLPILKPVKQY